MSNKKSIQKRAPTVQAVNQKPRTPKKLMRCQVCFDRISLHGNAEPLTCVKCKKTCHSVCYRPNEKASEAFMCDPCRKNKEPSCLICGHSKGLLKAVEGQNRNYVHVLCGLMNPKTISLKCYTELSFRTRVGLAGVCQKMEINIEQVCFYCKREAQSTSELIKCKLCSTFAHIHCILQRQKDEVRWENTSILLQKNAFQYRNIEHLAILERYSLFKYVKSTKKQHRVEMLCPQHADESNFNYCFCNEQPTDSIQKTLYACQKCGRWVHFACSGLNDTRQSLTCQPCRSKQPLRQQVKYSRLFLAAFNMEKQISQSAKGTLKLLTFFNRFPIPFSQKLMQSFEEDKVIRHYLGSHFQRLVLMLDKQNRRPHLETIFIQTKLIELLYLVIEGKNDLPDLPPFDQMTQKIASKIAKAQLPVRKEIKQKLLASTTEFMQLKRLCIQITDSPKLQNGQSDVQEVENCQTIIDTLRELPSKFQHCRSKQILYSTLQGELSALNAKFEAVYGNKLKQKRERATESSLIGLLLSHPLENEQISTFLTVCTNLLLTANQGNANQISESLHHQTHYFFRNLSGSKRNKYEQLVFPLLNTFQVNWRANQTFSFKLELQNRLSKRQLPHGSNTKIQGILAKYEVYLPKNSCFDIFSSDQIYYQQLKLKCLTAISKPLDEKKNKQLSQFIQELFRQGSKMLSEEEVAVLKNYQFKHQFFNKMLEKSPAQSYCPGMLDQSNSQKQTDQVLNKEQTVLERVQKVFMDQNISLQFFLQGVSVLQENRVTFNEEEKVFFKFWFDLILDRNSQQLASICFSKIKFQELKKHLCALRYCGRLASFPQYQREYNKYLDWEGKINNLNAMAALENEEQVGSLMQTLQQALVASKSLEINIKLQVEKLKVLKLWCSISKKYFQLLSRVSNRRPTVQSVFQLEILMNLSRYPRNKLWEDVSELAKVAQTLNKNLKGLFQKPQPVGQLQIHEQIALYQQKMTFQSVQQFKESLKSAKCQFGVQVCEINILVESYSNSPIKNYRTLLETQNVQVLQGLRENMMNSWIRSDQQEAIQQVITRVYALKALKFEPPIQRAQFEKIIQWGGNNALTLISVNKKAARLLAAYRVLQKAEKQVLNSRSRNCKNLLQRSKINQLLEDLQPDPTTKIRVNSWLKTYLNYSKKVIQAKQGFPEQYEKLKIREQQLLRIPINSKELINDHHRMKREIDYFDNRVKNITLEEISENGQSSFMMTQNINTYRSIGIRSQPFQKLLNHYNNYKEILKLKTGFKVENYRNFARKCEQFHQVSKLGMVCFFRYEYFQAIYGEYTKKQTFSEEILDTLFKQGSLVLAQLNLRGPQKKDLLAKLMEINQKLCNDEGISDDFISEQISGQEIHRGREVRMNSCSFEESSDRLSEQYWDDDELGNSDSGMAIKRKKDSIALGMITRKKRKSEVVEIEDEQHERIIEENAREDELDRQIEYQSD